MVISGISLVVSAILGAVSTRKSNNANKIAQGQIELYINQLISNTKKDVMDITLKVAEASDDSQKKSLLKQALNSAIEINLNAYDEACAKYIDNKVDKERFKKIIWLQLDKKSKMKSIKRDLMLLLHHIRRF